jgi:NAD(P)-dependent dehydrogenase (short-subunit alcohol dehydrogenase family)
MTAIVKSSRLQDKVAVITGTASGQGRCAALLFAAAGAKVVGCDLNAAGAQETLETVLAQGGTMTSVHACDVSERAGARELVRVAVDTYGGVDVLYNNAAYAFFGAFEDITYEQWSGTLKGELDVIFHATQEAWPHLAESRNGSIVNTASIAGLLGFGMTPEQTPHSAGKGGVQALTRQLAAEGRRHGIRANSISPGFIETPILTPYLTEEWVARLLANQLVKRAGRPEDVAWTALFLASDEASFITGKDIAVDGGMTSWVCPT